MSGMATWIYRRWAAVSLLPLMGLFLVGGTSEAPLFLYPATPSLPAGLYLRVGGAIERGSIVAFPVPEPAQDYQRSLGRHVDPGFLFLKPAVALAGDRVCNSVGAGLRINGRQVASTASHDRQGRPLPVWQDCRSLAPGELFTFTDHVPNSFDGRYYGPIDRSSVVGIYRRLWSNPWIS